MATAMDFLDATRLAAGGGRIDSFATPSDHFDNAGRDQAPDVLTSEMKLAQSKHVASTIDELRKHELTDGPVCMVYMSVSPVPPQHAC